MLVFFILGETSVATWWHYLNKILWLYYNKINFVECFLYPTLRWVPVENHGLVFLQNLLSAVKESTLYTALQPGAGAASWLHSRVTLTYHMYDMVAINTRSMQRKQQPILPSYLQPIGLEDDRWAGDKDSSACLCVSDHNKVSVPARLFCYTRYQLLWL